jgi:hypothetical protein
VPPGLCAAITKGLFGCGIELDDLSGLVDRDDAVERRGSDGRIQRLAALEAGKVAGEAEIAFDAAGACPVRNVGALYVAMSLLVRQPALPAYCLALQCAIRTLAQDDKGLGADQFLNGSPDEIREILVRRTESALTIDQQDARR